MVTGRDMEVADINNPYPSENLSGSRSVRRPVFSAPVSDWKRGVLFLLSLSLFGLSFYPALLFVILCMIMSWQKDRMHFMIQLIFIGGVFSMYPQSALPSDLLMLLSFVFIVIVRKDRLTWKLLAATFMYMAVLLYLMSYSIESYSVQLRGFKSYMMIITFMLPLGVFAGEKFEMHRFFQVVMVYAAIMCVFYVIDTFVFHGWVLVPAAYCEYGRSVLWNPIMRPFALWFPRKYPPGLYILALCVYPLIYVYRLNIRQIIVLLLAFFATRTMTVIAGLVMGYVLFQRNVRRTLMYISVFVVAVVGLYIVDRSLGGIMRISTTVEQFTDLNAAKDREDLAEFGSTRMAQIIPKMEMLFDKHKEWIGFGFIHNELSKNSAVQLSNDLYSDIEKADENLTVVEVTQIHTILMVGFIGLIVQTIYYVALYFILRRSNCRYSKYYLSVLVIVSIFGLGGFGGLTQYPTLLLLGLALGVVVLQHRREEADETDSSIAVAEM